MASPDTGDLADGRRYGCGSWALGVQQVPAVAHWMTSLLPEEKYDPFFLGQHLHTTYFDTLGLDLRKARAAKDWYATLRLRCYLSGSEGYALSVKTESEKWRQEITPQQAKALLAPGADVLSVAEGVLPPHLLARLLDVAGDEPLCAAAQVHCYRFAVESQDERLTLDTRVHTQSGKELPWCVLEYKATTEDSPPPGGLSLLGLAPIKLSKFLWATCA